MKCMECGGAVKTMRENVRYTESGLPNVVLHNVEVRKCAACGEIYTVIPRIEQLHAVMARSIATKRSRLAPSDVRFLRKYLGWDSADFAKHMGVSAETASRWQSLENPTPIGTTADRLLRLMVLTRQPKQDYTLDMLKEVAQTAPRAERVDLRERDHQWMAVPA